jgi:hypothetical protein
MAFQWVFDHAASVSLNEREVVGISETRNETIRTVSRGSAVRKYSVIMPAGMQWSVEQANINAVDVADRFTVETITFNAAYMTWMNSTSIATGSTVDLICVEIPDWVISDRDIVRWSGPFKFVESII